MASVVLFVDAFLAPKDSDPGRWLAAGLGVLMVVRALIATPQPVRVVASGCFLTFVVVGGNHGLISANRPLWVVPTIVAGFVALSGSFADKSGPPGSPE